MRKVILVIILLFGTLFSLKAQTFDASQWNQEVRTITALWRFHPGDDPAWASPAFDDSNWPLLATNRDWQAQGYGGLKGYAWYRLRMKLPVTTQPLAIDTGMIVSAAEIYVDGKLVGTNGVMRPKPEWSFHQTSNAYPLPVSCNGRWVEIAIRAWKSPIDARYATGGFSRSPIVGSLPLLQAASRVVFYDGIAGILPEAIIHLLMLVLGCFGLGLFLLDRRSTEYAWFALAAIGPAILFLIATVVQNRQGSLAFGNGDLSLLYIFVSGAEALFLWGFLRVRRDWMLLTVIVLSAVEGCLAALEYHGLVRFSVASPAIFLVGTAVNILLLTRFLLSLRAGSRDARLLVVPVVLQVIAGSIDGIHEVLYWVGLSRNVASLTAWSNGIVTVQWSDVFGLLYFVAIGAALVLRFSHSAREEKRLATELESARAVQEHLVPAQLPTLSGLDFGAAYLPAAEVGGDFYQVFPQSDGSALLVVGDVSGKGLRAAMTGTLVLGGLRLLAQESVSPRQVLHQLNNLLAHSPDGGFVTCLCARIGRDGLFTVANAGHLAPYRNGEECEVDSGLPLGIVANAEYTETTLQLEAGDALTFMSDGVVEAQAASGELFGFDRTRAICDQSAEEIAAAAQQFGQRDDITVLTVGLAPAEVLQA